MIVFVFGFLMAVISTLSVRFIAKGEAFFASIAMFLSTLLGVIAVVDIVTKGSGAVLYALGISIGSYIAIVIDKKRGE